MTDYSIAVSSVPLSGNAVANLDTANLGIGVDVDSITATWKDQNGLTLVSMTRTVADVSSTDIYGNAATLIDIAGTGTYRSTLVIDATNYTPPATGLRWSVTVTAVKGATTSTPTVFYFYVVPTTLSVSLDTTSVANVVMRQTGILKDVQHVSQGTNAVVPLQSGPVYAIAAAYKNGTPIASPTDYAWAAYRSNVTVSPAPAVNDHYTFTVQTRSSDYVQDIVGRHSADVLRALRPHYPSDALLQSPSVVELVKALCIGQIKQDLSQGVALDSAFYRSGRDLQLEALAAIRRIQRGEEGIYDATLAALPRTSGSVVGGKRHADGDFVNRLGLQDRAQQHTGLYVSLMPDPILASTRASRGFTA